MGRKKLAALAALLAVFCVSSLGAQTPQASRLVIANAGTTGTTLNKLAKFTGAPSTAVNTATTDTGGAIGITIAGAGTSGNAVIQLEGSVSCVFDGATTAGDYVQISSSTAGDCHDAGSSYPSSAQVVGRAISTHGSGGTYTMYLFPAEISATAGSGGSVLTVFTRSGNVVATSGDYTCAQVTNCASQGGVQNQSYTYSTGGGTANAQTLTLTPALSAYAAGQYFCWLPTAANTTTTPTLNVSGLGAKTIVKAGGAALVGSDLTTSAIACALYDGTDMELQNPQTGGGTGTVTSVTGDGTVITNSASTGAVTLTIAGTSGGVVCFGSSSSWKSSSALTSNVLTKGGGAGNCPTNSSLTDNGTNVTGSEPLLISNVVDGEAPVTVTTGSSATLGGTYDSGYTFNEEGTAATAVTYTLPTAAAGKQYCVKNAYNGSAADTGTLELLTSASGQYIIFTDGTLSASGGYVISGGAAADAACVVGVDSTHWILYVSSGAWAKH